MIEKIKRAAYTALNRRGVVLAPTPKEIRFPQFDPCRAVMPIAIVEWRATVNMEEKILTHVIMPGDISFRT